MTVELDVLADVSARLELARIPYMVTGSMALAFYAQPRMTRDIDIVVALEAADFGKLQAALRGDFYFDAEAGLAAIRSHRLFNLMHVATAMKVDLIIRKPSEYRRLEFDRRRMMSIGTGSIWIVAPEDLVLSKLEWSKESGSELQQRDVRQLLSGSLDMDYLMKWARLLGVESGLKSLMP